MLSAAAEVVPTQAKLEGAPGPLQMTSFLNQSRFGGAGEKYVKHFKELGPLKTKIKLT